MMKKESLLLHVVRLAVLLFFLGTACHAQIWAIPIYIKMKFEETRLEFYGKVVDQHGNPIQGAKVIYRVSRVGFIQPTSSTRECMTDSDGRFEIHGWRAAQLFINSIECSGYVYKRDSAHTRTVFEFLSSETKCHKADRSKPIEYCMRKKHPEAVYLREDGFGLEITPKPGEEWCGYDMKKGWDMNARGFERAKRNPDNRVFADFELSGKYNPDTRTWEVTLKANGVNAGFQFSNELLFEAPEDGYVKEMTISCHVMDAREQKEVFPKYMYARVRDPGFYFRGRLGWLFVDKKRFSFQFAGYLNPFGGRCLERLEITDYDEKHRLDEETKKAMYQQRLVEQPDFRKMIQEGKARY